MSKERTRNAGARERRTGRPSTRTSARAGLEAEQFRKLRRMLRAILPTNAFYAGKLAGCRPDRLRSAEALAALPFTSKQELLEDQAAHSPYGTNLTHPLEHYCRLHQTSGTTGAPLRWLDTPESWAWFLACWQAVYDLIGLRPDDRIFFAFSFGPFLGFWGAFEAAAARGNLCLTGGGMTSAARLRLLLDNAATVVACTPSYALRLAEVAASAAIDLAASPVRAVVVAGEPGGSIPGTRAEIESAWGARVFDHTGMTEIGALSAECAAQHGGVHVIENEFIIEVVDPVSGAPRPRGEPGELVVTNLGRWASPVVRYRTGDLVRIAADPCPCGRVWARLDGGIQGRLDDMLVVRGNNLYPVAIEALLRSIPGVGEFRCTVAANGPMQSLRIEVEPRAPDATAALGERVSRAFQDRFLLRADVVLVPPGTLPRFEMKARRFVRAP